MKKIVRLQSLVLYLVIGLFIGYFIGRDIQNDFFSLYVGKMRLLPVRYTLLLMIVLVSNLLGNIFLNSTIIVREKNVLNLFLVNIKYEIVIYALIFISLHIPILAINFEASMNYILEILTIIFNAILISITCSAFIKFIDLKIKNRVFSSCGFLIFYSLFDLLFEYFNLYFFTHTNVDFSCIFTLPVIFNHYLVLAVILILLMCLLTYSVIRLSSRKDYFLRNENKL